MSFNLPYIFVDEDYYLNTATLILIIDNLSQNSRGTYKLDVAKIQVFMFLLKHPSYIVGVLEKSGKKIPFIEENQIYTMDSLSINVDELFQIQKTKSLLRTLSSLNLLGVSNEDKNSLSFYLTEKGTSLAKEFIGNHFDDIKQNILIITPLLSMKSSKLHSVLNNLFKDK